MRMVRKAGLLSDCRDGFVPAREFTAGPCDSPAAHELSHRAADSSPEQPGEVHRMNPRDTSDVRQSVRVHQLRLEKLDRAVEASMRLE